MIQVTVWFHADEFIFVWFYKNDNGRQNHNLVPGLTTERPAAGVIGHISRFLKFYHNNPQHVVSKICNLLIRYPPTVLQRRLNMDSKQNAKDFNAANDATNAEDKGFNAFNAEDNDSANAEAKGFNAFNDGTKDADNDSANAEDFNTFNVVGKDATNGEAKGFNAFKDAANAESKDSNAFNAEAKDAANAEAKDFNAEARDSLFKDKDGLYK